MALVRHKFQPLTQEGQVSSSVMLNYSQMLAPGRTVMSNLSSNQACPAPLCFPAVTDQTHPPLPKTQLCTGRKVSTHPITFLILTGMPPMEQPSGQMPWGCHLTVGGQGSLQPEHLPWQPQRAPAKRRKPGQAEAAGRSTACSRASPCAWKGVRVQRHPAAGSQTSLLSSRLPGQGAGLCHQRCSLTLTSLLLPTLQKGWKLL